MDRNNIICKDNSNNNRSNNSKTNNTNSDDERKEEEKDEEEEAKEAEEEEDNKFNCSPPLTPWISLVCLIAFPAKAMISYEAHRHHPAKVHGQISRPSLPGRSVTWLSLTDANGE